MENEVSERKEKQNFKTKKIKMRSKQHYLYKLELAWIGQI